jgi:ppGpp synthetase/RelA/SpoT-type nucleotidyltranferase
MGAAQEFSLMRIVLGAVLADLKAAVEDALQGNLAVDSVAGRVKSSEQFALKAQRLRDGKPRYAEPLREIQDQIGIRVMVKFVDDIPAVVQELESLFNQVERLSKRPENPEEFGYEAVHLVCTIPPDLMATHAPHVDFFEIQVCTLFQHAWAELNHDLGYKPSATLDWDQRRLKSVAASSAWAADRAFSELRRSLRN